MAETATVFDIGAFGSGFDNIDVVPVLLKVEVTPEQQEIAAGQAVVIKIQVGNQTTSFGRTFLFSPGAVPQITIYTANQDNTVLQAATNMTLVETGIYIHRYQTSQSDAKGVYSAIFTAANGSMSMRSSKHAIYTIV